MNTFKIKKIHYLLIVILACITIFSGCAGTKEENKTPKYIFLFIGDGMGTSHVALSEAYFSNITGKIGFEKFTMTGFPVLGLCETYCRNRQITDSGAAGSAIACGTKANVDAISYFEDTINNDTQSIAKIAKSKGLKTGIITTVSLDHATPAAFYAINKNRSNYYEIGLDLAASNFDFFGGGSFYYPEGKNNDNRNLIEIIKENGYITYNTYEDLQNISSNDEKVVYINPVTLKEGEMPYAIDRKNQGGACLQEIIKSGIEYLNNENGFFIMTEGGKIDWCSHENDAATIIYEVKDFDDAVKEAYNFYLQYPDETLIIVTADHETGGISIGNAINNYENNLQILNIQKTSQYYFGQQIADYKKNKEKYDIKDIINMAQTDFYSEHINFTEEEFSQITEAFNYYFHDKTNYTEKELYKLYGGYNPISVTFTKILNNRAAIGFTSWSHTGTRVPVYSIGKGSEKFSGNMNNTDIKRKIMEIMNW
ncbi:MAG: alkaline phosphatase [Bacteroidales bacterium]|jgi:alkaline phosphatase|nr:alkaline phosphatase [Bacteroidales bacterium]